MLSRFRRVPGVMGIINVTPDSFSDGGRYLDAETAIEHGLRLAGVGADVLDVGAESTRPGAEPVATDEELRRARPVVEGLAARTDVPVSIDTTKAAVAAACIEAGAAIVNDVSAGLLDDEMLGVVSASGAAYVAMHMRGTPPTMQDDPHYDDVVTEVTEFLAERIAAARGAGIGPDRLMVDPGIGFGKTFDHNMALLTAIPRMVAALDAPLLVGVSRKSVIGAVLDVGLDDRDDGTLATTVWAFDRGAAMVRVHDVASAARARNLLEAMKHATAEAA